MLVNRVIARRDTPSAIIWRAWTRFSLGSAGELGLHVLLLQRLDRIPVELQLLGNVLDRRLPTALAHVMGKALRIERVVRQEIEPLALHLAATAASHPPDLDLQEDVRVAARQIANPPYTPVVPTRMNPPTASAIRFFARRTSVMRRTFGSPKTPRTVGWGESRGTCTCPTGAAVASMNWPSRHHAQFNHLTKPRKPNIHGASSHISH